MSKSKPLWWSNPSAISRYAIAGLSVAIALVAASLVVIFLHTEPFVSLLICAIMFGSWFGGFGPGLFAIVLSLLAFHYYLAAPINSFAAKFNSFAVQIDELPRIALFAIAALFVNFLSAAQRRAAESLRRSRNDLLAAIESQRRIEGALRQSENYSAEAQRLSQTGSFGWDASSGTIFCSDQASRIFGYDKTVPATVDIVLQRIHPEDLALVQRIIDRATSDGKDFDFECRLLMPDRPVKRVHIVAHALRNESGKTEVVGAVMDVTERKQADEALRQAQTELARVTRLTTMAELTASITHEIVQPLSAVVTNSHTCLHWLDDKTIDLAKARSAATRAVRDAERTNDIIGRIRALMIRSETRKVEMDINATIREVLALTNNELLKRQVLVRAELGATLLPVLGDRIQPQQLMLNLIMNGVEAMASVAGRPKELTINTRMEGTDHVLILVRDCGVGQIRKARTKSSTHSLQRSPRGRAWDWRFAARSSKHTTGASGRHQLSRTEPCSSSRCHRKRSRYS